LGLACIRTLCQFDSLIDALLEGVAWSCGLPRATSESQ